MARSADPAVPGRLDRWAGAYGWLFAAILGVMSVLGFESPLRAGRPLQAFTIVMGLFDLLGLVLLATIRRRSGRSSWPRGVLMSLGLGCALFGWAMLTTAFHTRVVTTGGETVQVPQHLVLIPLVNGLLALAGGFLTAAVTPVGQLFALLWRIAAGMVPVTLLGWWRVSMNQDHQSTRLWTQLGGAAVYPVALVLAISIALAALARGYHSRLSQWVLVANLIFLVLTASRGGVVMVVVLGLLVALRLGRRYLDATRRLHVHPVVLVVGAVGLLLAAVSSTLLDRALRSSSPRLHSWHVGLEALAADRFHPWFGLGSGTVWPWFFFESGARALPGNDIVQTPYGRSLYHAHSLYITVLVELGLVGCLLLVGTLFPLMRLMVRLRPAPLVIVAAGLCACLTGFAFDLVLFKNFGISMLWWFVLFALLFRAAHSRPVVHGRSTP